MSISRNCLKARSVKRKEAKEGATIVDSYLLGDTARHEGKTLSDNPFPVDSEDAADWSLGWQEAMV